MADFTITDIAGKPHGALVPIWTELMGTTPPKRLSGPLMARILAYTVQSRARRSLPVRTRNKLLTLAKDDTRPAAPGLQPGGRLVRTWNGETHEVEVLEKGFAWRGHTYRSLSAIAEAITGTRWSGPRFFGLMTRGSAR
jgi:hypothetical protein